MKLDWIKYNLLPALMVFVFLGLMGYGAWGWFRASAQNRELTSAVQAQEERIANYNNVRHDQPFPSWPNVAKLQKDRVQLEDLYSKLEAVAARPVDAPSLTPVQFASRLAQALKRLQTAARAKEVVLPDRFTFGFSDINRLAPATDVPALTRQLIVTEALCSNLFADGIQKLNSFQTDTEGTTTNGLYRRTPFTLKFACDTAALRKFLNDLQEAGWLFAVRSIQIESTTLAPPANPAPSMSPMPGTPGAAFVPGAFPPGFPMPPAATGRSGGRLGAPVPATPVAPVVNPVPTQPPQTVLNVIMQIDLLEFLQPSAGAKTRRST